MCEKTKALRTLGGFCWHLGKTVDMSLVDELVMRGSGAALVDTEEVLLGYIYELIHKNTTRNQTPKGEKIKVDHVF